jgi:HPr kinase/phosphorylase
LPGETERIHATALAFGEHAVLLRGPSGSGKSDLALRCLGLAPSQLVPGAVRLVGDDQVLLKSSGEEIWASPPDSLRGLLEVRGLGIVQVGWVARARVALVVDLVTSGTIERFPDPWPQEEILNVRLPRVCLSPFESATPLKVAAAVLMATQQRIVPKA